jgi:Ca2+-binding RTX toxin-like protein
VRRTGFLLALMAAALVVVSGVALAKAFVGTSAPERIVGTDSADTINAKGGNDVVLGQRGPDRIRGNSGRDKQYGGRGNDVIISSGNYRDFVNCGRGKDLAYVDSTDEVALCERVR